MLTRLVLLMVLLLPGAVLAAGDPFFTPEGAARPLTLTYIELLYQSGTTDEWTRRITLEVSDDGIAAVRTERRGGREILRNEGWLTAAQYRAFVKILQANRMLEWNEAKFGLKGFEANECEIRLAVPGQPVWIVHFTTVQAGKLRELGAVRSAFLDLVPPVDEHRHYHGSGMGTP